jgi:undecaprenyl-diphosphatase
MVHFSESTSGSWRLNTFDLSISSFINNFAHRSIRFDTFVTWLSEENLLKGGVIFAIVWWLWFRSEDGRRIREVLLASILACFPALAVARVLSWIIDRPRPLNEPSHAFKVPYGAKLVWEGPASFPSDHSVLFFALATGIYLASRKSGWFALGYISLFICLPRIYLAEHYTTDILAGAAIGIFMVLAANVPIIRKTVTAWAFRCLDWSPGVFYASAFILTFQMAELFDPLLRSLKVARLIFQGKPL